MNSLAPSFSSSASNLEDMNSFTSSKIALCFPAWLGDLLNFRKAWGLSRTKLHSLGDCQKTIGLRVFAGTAKVSGTAKATKPMQHSHWSGLKSNSRFKWLEEILSIERRSKGAYTQLRHKFPRHDLERSRAHAKHILGCHNMQKLLHPIPLGSKRISLTEDSCPSSNVRLRL